MTIFKMVTEEASLGRRYFLGRGHHLPKYKNLKKEKKIVWYELKGNSAK